MNQGFFDFRAFEASCLHPDKALAMVTPDNCNALDDDYGNNDTIIDNYAYNGNDNESVSVIEALLKRGCKFTVKSLKYALLTHKPKALQCLLSHEPELLWSCLTTQIIRILNSSVKCMVICVEHALRSGCDNLPYTETSHKYIKHHKFIKSLAMRILFAKHPTRDVSCVIARLVWSSRFHSFDPLQ